MVVVRGVSLGRNSLAGLSLTWASTYNLCGTLTLLAYITGVCAVRWFAKTWEGGNTEARGERSNEVWFRLICRCTLLRRAYQARSA
jgi:hypothetical protein